MTPRRFPQRLLRRRGRHRQPVQHRAPGILRGGTPDGTLPDGGLDRSLRRGVPGCMLRGGVRAAALTGGVLSSTNTGGGSGRIGRVSRSAGLPRGEPCEEPAEADTGRRRSRPRPWSDWLGVAALGLRLLLLHDHNTRTGHRQPPDPFETPIRLSTRGFRHVTPSTWTPREIDTRLPRTWWPPWITTAQPQPDHGPATAQPGSGPTTNRCDQFTRAGPTGRGARSDVHVCAAYRPSAPRVLQMAAAVGEAPGIRKSAWCGRAGREADDPLRGGRKS